MTSPWTSQWTSRRPSRSSTTCGCVSDPLIPHTAMCVNDPPPHTSLWENPLELYPNLIPNVFHGSDGWKVVWLLPLMENAVINLKENERRYSISYTCSLLNHWMTMIRDLRKLKLKYQPFRQQICSRYFLVGNVVSNIRGRNVVFSVLACVYDSLFSEYPGLPDMKEVGTQAQHNATVEANKCTGWTESVLDSIQNQKPRPEKNAWAESCYDTCKSLWRWANAFKMGTTIAGRACL